MNDGAGLRLNTQYTSRSMKSGSIPHIRKNNIIGHFIRLVGVPIGLNWEI
jgi:hypothetical protein